MMLTRPQVEAPKSGACARACGCPPGLPQPVPHLPTPSLDIPRLEPRGAIINSSAAMSNLHWPPAPTLHPKKGHLAIAGASQIYHWTGVMDYGGWDAPTRLAASARISAGVCVHAKPNRDYDCPHSTQQVVRLPGSPGPVVLNCSL